MAADRLLLVGNFDRTHIGSNFFNSASELKIPVRPLDVKEAFEAPAWLSKFEWWFRGRKPPRLKEFSQKAIHICLEFKPRWLLAVGLAPLEAGALDRIGKMGIPRFNYLTDNPWNPAHRAPWFIKALPFYSHVFSVRRSCLENLRKLGCAQASFLPFACAPELHYPAATSPEERIKFETDAVFIGGADPDRIPYISALIKAGFKIGLYGGYWERFKETKAHTRGLAGPEVLRKAITHAKVALCLVRRANGDGNSMRTFEIPAIGSCMLTEDTEEHREIFGEEGKAVVYFRTVDEMVGKLRWLLSHEAERRRLAEAAHRLITQGKHTYKDRLIVMLNRVAEEKITPSPLPSPPGRGRGSGEGVDSEGLAE